MKKLSVLLSLLFLLAFGCKSQLDIPASTDNLPLPHVENGYLVFSDYQAFHKLLTGDPNVANQLAAEWEKISGFTSADEYYASKTTVFNRDNVKLTSTDKVVIPPAVTFLAKVINQDGIVVIENKLFYFSRTYSKVLTSFKGDKPSHIAQLIGATTDNPQQNIYVKQNESTTIQVNSASARSYNNFFYSSNGNTIAIPSYDTGGSGSGGFVTGRVRGYVNGNRTNHPNNFCQNPDGSTYACGWDYSFSVGAHGDFYVDDYGVIDQYQQYITITWTTDRGNGSGTYYQTICSSGSGMYAVNGVPSFSDIEGTVTFSIYYNYGAGQTGESRATISL